MCVRACVCVCACACVLAEPCRDWSGLGVKGQINTAGTLLLAGLQKDMFFFFFSSAPSFFPPLPVCLCHYRFVFLLSSLFHVICFSLSTPVLFSILDHSFTCCNFSSPIISSLSHSVASHHSNLWSAFPVCPVSSRLL